MFAKVMGNVSVVGLRAAYGEYEQRMNTTDCHGITTGTMGHPCSHKFRIRGNQSLEIADFDTHWWLDSSPVFIHATDETSSFANILKRIQDNYESEISTYRRQRIHQHLLALPAELDIRDPVHMQGRGRPSGSTARLPSAFEHVIDQTEALEQPRRRNAAYVMGWDTMQGRVECH